MTQSNNALMTLPPALSRHLTRQLEHMEYRAEIARHAISEGAATQNFATFKATDLVSWNIKVLKMLDDIDEESRLEIEAFIKAHTQQTLEFIGQITQESFVKSLEQLAQIPVLPGNGLLLEVENVVLRLLESKD